MSRLYAGPVEVVRRDDVPEQFRWRGRHYVIREVLACWTETDQWWRTPVVSALTNGQACGPGSLELGERDWWRVLAGSGRSAAFSGGDGVYDLCWDWAQALWSLARVMD